MTNMFSILDDPKKIKIILKDILFKNQYCSTYLDYMDFARHITENSSTNDEFSNQQYVLNGINKLIRLLALDVQHNIFTRTLKHKHHCPENPPFFTFPPKYCPFCQSGINQAAFTSINNSMPIDISLNPAISFPWNFERLSNMMSKIGLIIDIPFTFDESNHFDNVLVLPINLLIIGNGYHSSFSGIYDSQAISYVHSTLDITSMYQDIYFDGVSFRHCKCNHVLDSPTDKSIGIIYEIGRLLTKHNLNLLSLHTLK